MSTTQPSTLPPSCKSVRLTRNLGVQFKKGTLFVRGSLKSAGVRGKVYFAVPAQYEKDGTRSWLSEGFVHGEFNIGAEPKVWTPDLFAAVIDN